MMKRGVAVLIGAVLALVLGVAPAAAEASSVTSGWWTTAPVPAPDVPAGALLVQGGVRPESPHAYAAVAADIAVVTTAVALVLAVEPDSATTPGAELTLCPLTASFGPAEGKPVADGPAYDCAKKVSAEASDDGTSFRFDLAALGVTGNVAVAVLPGAPTDRVVLAAPTTASVETEGAPTASGSSDSGETFSPSSDFFGGGTSSFGSGGLDTSFAPSAPSVSFDVPSGTLPEVPLVTSTPRAATRAPQRAELAAAAGDAPGDDDGPGARPLLFGLLAATAAALWVSAGREPALTN